MNIIIGFFALSGLIFWLLVLVFLLFYFISKEMPYMQQKELLTESDWWKAKND